ncbi:MAG: hypothetical protein WA728_35745, partial [Xanthobacteraceae bacterium]
MERMFVLGDKREDIRHFILGFFARVSAADSFPRIVDAIHVRNGYAVRDPEEAFQHDYDKLHRRVVVVQQQYVVARGVGHLCDLTPPKFACEWFCGLRRTASRPGPDGPISALGHQETFGTARRNVRFTPKSGHETAPIHQLVAGSRHGWIRLFSGGTFSRKTSVESKSNFSDGARGGNRTPTPCGTR